MYRDENYPTWCLNLWINDDIGSYEHYSDLAKTLSTEQLAEAIKEDVEASVDELRIPHASFLSDSIRWMIGQIDFWHIAEMLKED